MNTPISPLPRTVCVRSVPVHPVTLSQAVDFALSGARAPCFVVTPNAVMLDACRCDPSLTELLSRADLSLADGMGLLLAARKEGMALPCRVAGIAFGEALLARAAREGLRVFLLGGGEGVAEAAGRRLCARFSGLCICGTCWGYFQKEGDEDARVIDSLRAARPDILFVCMGFPMQERWIADHLHLLPSLRVAVGLGGSLDVWSGKVRRAPSAVSDLGLEWAWRMMLQPSRLKHLPALARTLLRR